MSGNKYPVTTKVSTSNGEYPITAFVTQEIFDSAVTYKPDPDDLFICTFPKNGTTWTLYILHMLRGGCMDFTGEDNLSKYYACIDFIGGERTKEFAQPRMIQTHLRFNQLAVNNTNKYIVVARNPKDTVVSFYYHTKGFDFYNFSEGKFDDFFDFFVDGKHDFGDYFEMVPYWWEESKKRKNVHFLLYEDLKSNFESELQKMAKFLGDDCHESLLKNDRAKLKAITEKAQINTMKKNLNKFMPRKRPEHLPFVRKGVIGDWRNILNQQQSQLVDDKLKEAGMKHPGFDRLWDSYREDL